MLVRTDDEVYRVDAVWLGPPRATFPWRARYVSYGVGLLVMMLIMMIQRRLGIGLDFFSVAWALVGTVAITRFLGHKIDYERPLGQVLAHFWAEVTGPRADPRANGGSVRARHVRIQTSRNQPALRAGATGRQGKRPGTLSGRAARPSLAGVTVPAPRPGSGQSPAAQRPAVQDRAVQDRAVQDRAVQDRAVHDPAVQDRAPAGPTVVDGAIGDPAVVPGTGETGPAEPQRIVPPLPDPVSAPQRGRFRKARGRIGKRGRGAAAPARTRQPEPWRRGGHRGRT
ncbi:hypothetical protein [Pseudonocardia sp. NPDC046786]|uniref:hypothetical protein n=1 Tax=Pseudonocardia sp. NPDC046786 TaxID=3155471 RepID=UPI0033FE5637